MSNSNKYVMMFILSAGLVYLLSPILTPFLVAALLAYLGNPLVLRLERLKWPRSIAVSVVFAVIFLLLSMTFLILLPLVEQQLSALIEKVPTIIAWAKQTVLPWLQARFTVLAQINVEQLQLALQDNIAGAGSMAASIIVSITSSGMAFLSGLATIVLIPVVTFYLLRDWGSLIHTIQQTFPRRLEKKANDLTQQVDTVLAAFFKGQLIVMACLTVVYYVGLSMVGLEFALLIGLIAGLVSFVPYLGLIIGIILACLASIFQLQDGSGLVGTLLVFAVAQVLESVVLTPVLVGDKIGLHPVAVIFAVMAGGQLFGFSGVLLALPVAAVLLVFVRDLDARYKKSELYNAE